ncbi:MAG: 2-oxoacid:acceptor oxidoreductase subunit alpha [Gammaproteobacteria bacterium]|nr:2-oxoacid:acceptor oxidoreductase subunit alpha [Gammaproteobacteria bacterium]NIR84883.1 2-oxoacid:acceptor oxidoreductase subunit alpha [Gammaproteobacteria bacterium]NIR91732.1 2-oxoacid:acceptor oxidoreductase subunit alpha [Gammaproteobacteria bacterium]NIU05930.1 2-oxoacid:acceptor oxidoreductase subunit alpha [Gammaproteobacteria bacterium]NIV52977.1 2-oxoacid:acceptor oxidoreductase subunit alpha [Gammaproteobacteria bacterium]
MGSGGAGVLTVGNLLLGAAARSGCYGLLTRSVGPQIRGGEAAAMLRLSRRPVHTQGDGHDLLVALDWSNVERFAGEIVLGPRSVVVSDPDAGEVPAVVAAEGARQLSLPMKRLAKAIPGGRPNMVALGAIAAMLGLAESAVLGAVEKALATKGAQVLEASREAVRAGARAGAELGVSFSLGTVAVDGGRWLVTGNEAAGLGALRGGVRFVAGYPITPATDLLEWLAPAIAQVGGALVQAEDELASINMLIGASFGGVPSLTATSGPGFALMTESLGLAVAAEVPVVVVNVMRGGPSTGIPTKSEQADLNIAVYGLHGDAPHLVLAPTQVADCLFTTQWAVYLAERLQTPAVVLSDQFLGQARSVIDRPPEVGFAAQRERAVNGGEAYGRYRLTPNGVSPVAVPGAPGGEYTADGLTHDEFGTPSSRAGDHRAQLDKRRDKLAAFDYGPHWADVEGEGKLAVITWGSVTGAVREAVDGLRAAGTPVRLIALRLLAPMLHERLAAALDGVQRVLVVEQSHSGQFHGYLRAQGELSAVVQAFHRPGPLPIRPGEVRAQIEALGG